MSNRSDRSSHRPVSSYDAVVTTQPHFGSGIPIQCQFCSGQTFRRSRLRSSDFREILLMRYPVRCLRCSQRQPVSFTIAAISVPSHIRQRSARRTHNHTNWSEPSKHTPGATSEPQQEQASSQDHVSDRAS
jgi:hypothetical protein